MADLSAGGKHGGSLCGFALLGSQPDSFHVPYFQGVERSDGKWTWTQRSATNWLRESMRLGDSVVFVWFADRIRWTRFGEGKDHGTRGHAARDRGLVQSLGGQGPGAESLAADGASENLGARDSRSKAAGFAHQVGYWSLPQCVWLHRAA